MKIQLIRHATVKIRMNELSFLVDPILSAKECRQMVKLLSFNKYQRLVTSKNTRDFFLC